MPDVGDFIRRSRRSAYKIAKYVAGLRRCKRCTTPHSSRLGLDGGGGGGGCLGLGLGGGGRKPKRGAHY